MSQKWKRERQMAVGVIMVLAWAVMMLTKAWYGFQMWKINGGLK
jgi:hypothetical protein